MARPASIRALLRVDGRFVRSVHLERDFADPHALDTYVGVPFVFEIIRRIVAGVDPASKRRAWRITGDYGVGKSSLGLLLSRAVAREKQAMPAALWRQLAEAGGPRVSAPLLPLLVTCSRESVASALAKAVIAAADSLSKGRRKDAELDAVRSRATAGFANDDAALESVILLRDVVASRKLASGVLLLLDEMGKLLEFAALHPERSDVYLLQQLAERAVRSGDQPIVIVGMLHQGFRAYADPLPLAAQQEWAKVAARFEEILFDQPLTHVAALVARALDVRRDKLPPELVSEAEAALRASLASGWFGAISARDFPVHGEQLYPLHPTVMPVAVRFLRRYGQNERSLFAFLLSDEPMGLQSWANRSPAPGSLYRISDFYDYVRANWGHSLGGRSYQAQWLRIVEIVDGAASLTAAEHALVKVVGLLNLLDADDLRATPATLEAALGIKRTALSATIERVRRRRLIFDRGASGGLCLWPHTSVDLEAARLAAEQALGPITRVAPLLAGQLDATPFVARRHYVERGTLRHFEVRYTTASDAVAALGQPMSGDGLVLVILCDTASDEQIALAVARSPELAARPEVLIAVPAIVAGLAGLVQEARAWRWVLENTPELNHDRHAAAEVASQVDAATRQLDARTAALAGLRHGPGASALRWHHGGAPTEIGGGRALLGRLSAICDEIYPSAPRITNELLNRRVLSSAASRARMALIDALLGHAEAPGLGLPSTKAPPERAVYLSILSRGRVHREVSGRYAITEPPAKADPLRLRPALQHVGLVLRREGDARVPVDLIAEELRRAPFGIRDGLIPLLLAVYAKAHEHELAMYEDEVFRPRIGGADFQRLIKAPSTFAMQLCRTEGVRAEVYSRVLETLGLMTPEARSINVLDVVTPLCEFAARLPPYTIRTSGIPGEARAVRDVLLRAKDPTAMLFTELPNACGAAPFGPDDPHHEARATTFVGSLRAALDTLRNAYPELLGRLSSRVFHTFHEAPNGDARSRIARRAATATLHVREPRLRGFCLRLSDEALPHDQWVEAVGSYVRERPPSRWVDGDEAAFAETLASLGETHSRVEAIAFSKSQAPDPHAMRLTLTRGDGVEQAQVIHLSDSERQEAERLFAELTPLLRASGRAGLAATARLAWSAMESERTTQQ